ncbi:hypothetical protein [Caulobacter sp. BE254]|uniref:hypothetical protein n=1 Tax=Caulobacter sp. BE254 TaxID=2817720 RepID=UPI00285994D7|nr:hypothetical protein [Caulobacter sp. BE254]MDR7116102.1 hypothetical protein [Caulobacter sp. BE254]
MDGVPLDDHALENSLESAGGRWAFGDLENSLRGDLRSDVLDASSNLLGIAVRQ